VLIKDEQPIDLFSPLNYLPVPFIDVRIPHADNHIINSYFLSCTGDEFSVGKGTNFPALQVSYIVKDNHVKETEMTGKCGTHERDENFIPHKIL
jgi:hypothetical protein